MFHRYGKALVPDNAPVPEHLPITTNKASFLKPYPNKPDINVNDQMKAKGWTVKKMFQTADEFFQSLGLDPMPQVSICFIYVGQSRAVVQ